MFELVVLSEYFNMYKKIQKEGKNCLVVITDEYDMNVHAFKCNIQNENAGLPSDIDVLIHNRKKAILKAGYTPVVKVFKSVEDFIIS